MSLFQEKLLPLPSSFRMIEERKSLRIIRLQGSIDITQETEIDTFVTVFRGRKDFEFKNLLLDFQYVERADTSAVARLIKTIGDYKKSHHKLGAIHTGENILDVLKILKVDQLIHFYPSESEAVKDLES